MKKKLSVLISSMILFLCTGIFAFAQAEEETITSNIVLNPQNFFGYMVKCPPLIVVAAISIALILVFIIMRKKLKKALDGSTSSTMLTAFIVAFSVCGIGCFALAVATDGEAWSHMMDMDTMLYIPRYQFSDYFYTMRKTAVGDYMSLSNKFAPFATVVYYFLAQFVTPALVNSENYLTYLMLLRNQPAMLMYLFIVIVCIVLMYRMSRNHIRNNGCTYKNDLVAFLLIMSYPGMYCVERGNITGVSLMLLIFFIIYRENENAKLRVASYAALAVSAAMTPYTIFFIVLLFTEKNENVKRPVIPAVSIIGGAVGLTLFSAIFTGFGFIGEYIKYFFSIPNTEFEVGNTSISNLLVFFGINNKPVLLAVFLLTEITALICMMTLPSAWQRSAAAVYMMLNIPAVSNSVMYIFIVVPFLLLISEKTHKAINWMYLFAFSLIIIPFPEWYYYEKLVFSEFMQMFGLYYITSANQLISLTAIQLIFVLLFSQLITALKENKAEKTEKAKLTA